MDVSKASDRLNHYCLFYKLLKRSVPVCLVNVLANWYSKLYSSVRWGSSLSDNFQIRCGIRQGGVLTPILFCVYVDEILQKLSKRGCKINEMYFSAFMYADDLVLLSPSVSELQAMIQICCNELSEVGLEVNNKKSCCLRFGRKHFVNGPNMLTPFGDILWTRQTKYLGLTLVAGNRLKISFEDTKCKFYASFNSLYSKLGARNDPSVSVHLLQTIAMPILTYAVESLNLNKTELSSLDFTLSRALYKIFKVSDKYNMKYCMDMFGVYNISELYSKRRSVFIDKIRKCENIAVKLLLETVHNAK